MGVALTANLFTMVSNAMIFYVYPDSENGIVNAMVFLCAFVGFLSGLPVGRLGNPLLECKIMMSVGVANVCIIAFVHSLLTSPLYCEVSSLLCYRDRGPQINTGSASAVMTICVLAAILLMSISMHLLAWPMHARYITNSACILFVVSLTPATPLTELGHDVELYLIMGTCFLGETIGFTMQRASRRHFLQRMREAEENASRMTDMLMRNEQLACEKERLHYEMKIRPVGRYARPKSMTSDSNMSNDGVGCACWPLSALYPPAAHIPTNSSRMLIACAHRVCSIAYAHCLYRCVCPCAELTGFMHAASSSSASAADTNDAVEASEIGALFAPISDEDRQSSSLKRRARQDALWRTLDEAGVLLPQEPELDVQRPYGSEPEGSDSMAEQDLLADWVSDQPLGSLPHGSKAKMG